MAVPTIAVAPSQGWSVSAVPATANATAARIATATGAAHATGITVVSSATRDPFPNPASGRDPGVYPSPPAPTASTCGAYTTAPAPATDASRATGRRRITAGSTSPGVSFD